MFGIWSRCSYAEAFSTKNYDALLNSWSKLDLIEYRIFHCESSYCTSILARQHIIDQFNWTIGDAGASDDCPNIKLTGSSYLELGDLTCENKLMPVPLVKYSIRDTNQFTFYVSNEEGEFSLPAYEGNYTIMPLFENSSYFEITPDSIVPAQTWF